VTGQAFELVGYALNWGEHRVLFQKGRRRKCPFDPGQLDGRGG